MVNHLRVFLFIFGAVQFFTLMNRGFIVLLSITVFAFCLPASSASAQNRLSTNNTVVWLNQFHTINVNKHWAVVAEYQWRRTEGLKNWQQSLLRGGIQYKFNNGLTILAGYAWTETFPYGDYPPKASQPFPEHRIYQQIAWSDNIGRVILHHRGRLEQRFLGVLNPSATDGREITKWNYVNRFRYQLKATVPINNTTLADKTFYAAGFDEIFIGFGKNVNANIFDQNRVGAMIGYRLNKVFSMELVGFNQTVQQPAQVDNKAVFQYNSGMMVNVYFNWN